MGDDIRGEGKGQCSPKKGKDLGVMSPNTRASRVFDRREREIPNRVPKPLS